MTKSGLVRYLLLVGIILMISAASVSKAKADSIDLSGLADGNKGPSLTIGGVTITAKFELSPFVDPGNPGGNPFLSGNDGTVFKGTSGKKGGKGGKGGKGSTGGKPFLGVQDNNGGGSPLISGEKKHEEEALTFTFAGGASSIIVTLVDFDPAKDTVDLYFLNGTVLLDVQSTGVLNFDQIGGVPGSFDSFAIRASVGHFGVGGLSYSNSVPEPSTMILLLTGLAGLGVVKGRRRRQS